MPSCRYNPPLVLVTVLKSNNDNYYVGVTETVTQSLAIIEFLEEICEGKGHALLPSRTNPMLRARVRQVRYYEG